MKNAFSDFTVALSGGPLQSDEEELEEVIKKKLLAWKRSREEKVKKPQFPAKHGPLGDPPNRVQYRAPKFPQLSCCPAPLQLSWGRPVAKEGESQRGQLQASGVLEGVLHLVKPKFKVPKVEEGDEGKL